MKAAVIFPGIGYHTDKPLLYYGKKLAKEAGYRIIEVNYTGFPQNVKGNEDASRGLMPRHSRQTLKRAYNLWRHDPPAVWSSGNARQTECQAAALSSGY